MAPVTNSRGRLIYSHSKTKTMKSFVNEYKKEIFATFLFTFWLVLSTVRGIGHKQASREYSDTIDKYRVEYNATQSVEQKVKILSSYIQVLEAEPHLNHAEMNIDHDITSFNYRINLLKHHLAYIKQYVNLAPNDRNYVENVKLLHLPEHVKVMAASWGEANHPYYYGWSVGGFIILEALLFLTALIIFLKA